MDNIYEEDFRFPIVSLISKLLPSYVLSHFCVLFSVKLIGFTTVNERTITTLKNLNNESFK